MRESRMSVLLALALAAALAGCNGSLPSRNQVCSGIPGDPATPRSATNAPATHGPGIATAAPVHMQAAGGWPHKRLDMSMSVTMFPMLYVYDEEARFALGLSGSDNPVLADPVLADAGKYGFWSEVSGNRYYELPGVSSCMRTLLLGDDFNFRAPLNGLLFVQYLTPQCANCDRVSAAIQRALDTHPQLPARWVQYDLASTTGTWCYKGYGFEPRERISRGDALKDFTCPK